MDYRWKMMIKFTDRSIKWILFSAMVYLKAQSVTHLITGSRSMKIAGWGIHLILFTNGVNREDCFNDMICSNMFERTN